MKPQTRMLWWREWRERKTQFLLCLLWMTGGAIYDIAYEIAHRFRAPVASFHTTAMLFGLVAPIFIAMRTASGEITDGTKSFSDSLPIGRRRQSWMRLAGGVAVLVAPIAVEAIFMSICLAVGWIEQAQPHDGLIRFDDRPSMTLLGAQGIVWTVALVSAWSSTALYLLLSVAGTFLRSESRAGFVGGAMAILWFLGSATRMMLENFGYHAAGSWVGVIVPQAMLVCYGYGTAHGTYGDISISSHVFVPLLINALLLLGLALWFINRHSRRLLGGSVKRARKPRRTLWPAWSPPLGTRAMALAWLAVRQATPMCLPGLLIACLMTPLQMNNYQWGETSLGVVRYYRDAMSQAMWIVATIWSAVVGAGLFSCELDARQSDFWRTRPISAGWLFAVKFIVGLTVVLGVLDGAAIVAAWGSPNWGEYNTMNWPYIACVIPLHATMFAIAVAWTITLGRAVLGGMAAIITFVLVNIGLAAFDASRKYGPIEVYNSLAHSGRSLTPASQVSAFLANAAYLETATAMALILLASIMIGWRALSYYNPNRRVD